MLEQPYLDLCAKILHSGEVRKDRTGTGTISIFGAQMRFNLSDGFPLLTTKRVAFGLVKSELLWFLKGDTNIKYLLENNNHIWDAWAYKKFTQHPDYQNEDQKTFCDLILSNDEFALKHGDLGKIYGAQWRRWETRTGEFIDQLREVISTIKSYPFSRRLIVSAWNPQDIPSMALPPCHTLFQFYVSSCGKLSCQLYQRSGDVFLGVPFNIASYSLLTHLIAHETDLKVGEFIMTLGDAHIYLNHVEQVRIQLSREPLHPPTLLLNEQKKSLFDFCTDDITVKNYVPHAKITAPVSV